jgi:hypothetical protein
MGEPLHRCVKLSAIKLCKNGKFSLKILFVALEFLMLGYQITGNLLYINKTISEAKVLSTVSMHIQYTYVSLFLLFTHAITL